MSQRSDINTDTLDPTNGGRREDHGRPEIKTSKRTEVEGG